MKWKKWLWNEVGLVAYQIWFLFFWWEKSLRAERKNKWFFFGSKMDSQHAIYEVGYRATEWMDEWLNGWMDVCKKKKLQYLTQDFGKCGAKCFCVTIICMQNCKQNNQHKCGRQTPFFIPLTGKHNIFFCWQSSIIL